VLSGNNGNSYTVYTQSDMCVCTHIVHSIETVVGQKKFKKWDSSECRVPKKFFRVPHVSQPRLRRKDILIGTATARHRRTLHYREFVSPELTGFKLAAGRSVIPTAHYKSPLVLQEPMLPISQCEFHSGSTGIASRPAVLRNEFPQDNTETAYSCQFQGQ
jgi:hypothetical protein